MQQQQQQQQPAGVEDDASVLHSWLTLHTKVPANDLNQYIEALSKDGATSLDFLTDAEYTREDLIGFGIKKPHIASILSAIQAYQDLRQKKGAGISSSSSASSSSSSSVSPPLPPSSVAVKAVRIAPEVVVSHDLSQIAAEALTGEGGEVIVASVSARAHERKKTQAVLDSLLQSKLAHVTGPNSPKPKQQHETTAMTSSASSSSSQQQQQKQQLLPSEGASLGEVLDSITGASPLNEICIHLNRIAGLAQPPEDICDALKQLLEKYQSTDDANLALSTLAAMARLSASRGQGLDAKQRWRLSEIPTCHIVVDFLKNHHHGSSHDDVIITARALDVMALLAREEANKTRFITKHAAHDDICKALASSPLDRSIQYHGLRAIVNLAAGSDENKRRLGVGGACELACKALTAFPQDRDVQYQGIRVIVNMTSSEEENEKDKNIRRCGSNGACEAIVQTLIAFPHDRAIQLDGCWAIANLASSSSDENKRKCGALGGCNAVATAMTNFSLDRDVIYYASNAIATLSASHDENKAKFVKTNVCTSLAKALDDFCTDRDVMDYVCWAVTNLAANNNESKKQLAMAGACEGIAQVMAGFATDRDLQFHACSCVMNLSTSNEENKKRFAAVNTYDFVKRAMKTFPQDSLLQSKANAALTRLS